jgi:PAS domain S-box-containing protein
MQEELRTSEERFRLLLDGVKDFAIYMLDVEGRVLSWNAGASRIKGYTSAEVVGTEFSRFYTPEARSLGVPLQELELAVSQGRFEGQGERVRKDGSRFWANAVITPMYDQAGALRGFSKVLRDITERRESEIKIRDLNLALEKRVRDRTTELEAANKELEAFTYSVSHDLRAPLRHIAGFSKMLAEGFGASLPNEGQHYLLRIQDGTRRMGMLVDDLLNLTRIGKQEPKLQVSGVESIVRDVIADLKPDIGDRAVEWKVGYLPYVEGDPALLRVVFQNLLANALKYSRPRPKAVIEVGRQEVDGQSVLFVRDNGVGFNMKYADKLFGVFQRLHRAEDFEGTGVGLAIVQRIVQKHGGRIWAEAAVNQGATFFFTLGGASAPP